MPAVQKDPVCGMTVSSGSPHVLEHRGEPVYFCCAGCQAKFAADPETYAQRVATGAAPTESPAVPTADATHAHDHAHLHGQPHAHDAPPADARPEQPPGTIYTCPMHPEIRQDHPGACPKCGMALEPESPSADETENPELIDFRRRFWWTLPLTVAVTLLAMLGHRLQLLDPGTQSWVELVLSAPVVLWADWPFFVRGVRSVLSRSPNMGTLIGLGTSAAFVYSAVATVAPGVFPESVRASCIWPWMAS